MPTSSKVKLVTGTLPNGAHRHLATIKHGNEVWRLYVLLSTARVSYVEWKLTSLEPVPHKASYWFSWVFKSACVRNGRSKDLEIMQAGRPALRAFVEVIVRELVRETGNPRLTDSSFEASTYSVSPSTPVQEPAAGGTAGGAGGNVPSDPSSRASPSTPVLPPHIQSGEQVGEEHGGSANDSDPSTLGDPDGDLL